jgi:hypothetical protein
MRSLFETFLRYTLSRKDYPHLKDLGLFIILFGLAIAGCRDNRNESLIDRSFLTDQLSRHFRSWIKRPFENGERAGWMTKLQEKFTLIVFTQRQQQQGV